MGFECGPSCDSNDNTVERNDVIPESSNHLEKNSETFECFIASSKYSVKINFNDSKFLKLEKKWIKCILNKGFENKTAKESLNKQIFYCNRAIESTLIKLNNYESVLLFSYIFYKHRDNNEFIKSVNILCIRWYFCLKYNFLLSEAPYLGAVSIFNSVIWGLKSIRLIYVQFIQLLRGAHECANEYISPILSYTDDCDKDNEECSNLWLIEMCPVFSKFQSACEIKEFCNQLVSYVFDITFSLSKEKMLLKYDGSSNGLTEFWNQLITWSHKSDCVCQVKAYMMLLDAYADMVFNGPLSDDTRNDEIRKLVGLYAKWLLVMTNENNVETSILKRSYQKFIDEEGQDDSVNGYDDNNGATPLENIQKAINEIECVYLNQNDYELYKCNNVDDFRGFIEGCKNYMSFSYSIIIRESVALYKKYELLPREMVIVAMGYVIYESGKSYDKCTDFAIQDSISYVEPLTLSLYRHEIGRMILSMCNPTMNYVKYEEDVSMEMYEYSEDYTHDVISEYCYRIYSSIADSCGRELDNKRLKVSVSTTVSTKVESGYIHYEFPEDSAKELLKQLLREVKSKISSVLDLCIYSDALEENHEMTREEIRFMKSNSALPCIIIAIASLMNDDVYLDVSSEGIVRVVVSYRSLYEYSEDKLSLYLKLFYCEVEDDCIMSLEYKNAELAYYRTLLLRYILQLSLSPMNSTSKIRFSFNGIVDMKKFTIRLFKFLNFRTNSALMDRIVFEKYLTTRVVIDHKNKNSNMNKKNITNGSSISSCSSTGYESSVISGHGRRSWNNNTGSGRRRKRKYELENVHNWINSHVSDSGTKTKSGSAGRKGKRVRRQKGEREGSINRKSKKKKANDSDSEENEEYDGMPLNKMLSVFGFLEYYGRTLKGGNAKLAVKSEDTPQNEKYFDAEYFFNLSFKFIGMLRIYLIDGPSFGSDIVDQFTFKYYLRLCSNDFYNTVNTAIIYSDIRQVFDTNQYGEKIENALLAQYLGEREEGIVEEEYNGFMESLGLLENESNRSRERIETKKSWKLQFVDLLKLNNRYTKRTFYTMTHEFCSEFFRFVPNSCLPNLLCSWASSLPTDTMSTVRTEKIATARFVIFILLCRISAAKYEFSTKFFGALEPLVSAVNVILVNLEIVYKAPTSYSMCEVISDDEETPINNNPCLQSSQEFNELVSGELDVSDSNFYENIVTKYNTIKAKNVKRMREKREDMRRRNGEQVNQLLQVSWLFGKVMDRITKRLNENIFDPENQYVTKTDDTYIVSCVGKKRALLYSMIDFLTLVDNTLSTIIRICVLSSLSISDSSSSEQCTPKRTIYSYKIPKQIKSETSNYSDYGFSDSYKESTHRSVLRKYETAKELHKYLEMMNHSEIIGKIKLHKQSVKSRLKIMSKFEFRTRRRQRDEEETSSECDDEEYVSGDEEEDEVEELVNGNLSDDLDGFIDFEADQHLSMLTYNKNSKHIHNNPKNIGANKRLKMTDLRSEWRCIIKSQLI